MKAFVTRRKRPLAVLSVLTVAIATAVAVSVGGAQARPQADELKGAGSTFVAPLVGAWQTKYQPAKISYNPIGSGGGIQAISTKTVDFGASDAPLTADQFKTCGGCVQLPWALSATADHVQPARASEQPAHHGPDHRRHLSRPDQEVGRPARSRPSTRASTCLPSNITPVYRSDSSGTTYNFTDVPEHGQQAVEVADRTRHERELAGRRRRTR